MLCSKQRPAFPQTYKRSQKKTKGRSKKSGEKKEHQSYINKSPCGNEVTLLKPSPISADAIRILLKHVNIALEIQKQIYAANDINNNQKRCHGNIVK